MSLPLGHAPAKINLCLHVTGQRPDGYHRLDSLVVFTGLGDRVVADPSRHLSLTLEGPFAQDLGNDADNLVLRAAEMIRPKGQGAALHLTKTLPVASGMGGGSADAAAALRVLADLWDVPLPGPEALARLGADVPVCLACAPARMSGIGEVLTPLAAALPPFWLVLANPGVHVPTPAVFQALSTKHNPALPGPPPALARADALATWLAAQTRNDLEAPARALAPVIDEVLSALAGAPACHLARMSGSGATCFGLFSAEHAALDAAAQIRAKHPNWWVAATQVLA